jgi:HEAT repeat protein
MSAENDPASKYRNDPRSTDDLLHLALTKDADRDNNEYWRPIAALQHRLAQIIERIQTLSKSGEEKSRDTAATILGQGWVGGKIASDHCAEILLQMLASEQSTIVLPSIIFALGHLHDPRAVEPLVGLSRHSDARVRYAAVSSLCGHDDKLSVEAMIACSSDADRDVRNWATFGLGSQIDTDTPAIRDALLARLEEKDDEIRGEALVGLACRGDTRVVAALLKELGSDQAEVLRDWILIDEAAEAVVKHATASGSKEWQPVLAKLAALGIGKREELQSAMNRCDSKEQ